MQRLTRLARPPRSKGTIPGFASDTLTKVYRDAMYGPAASSPSSPGPLSTAGQQEDRPSATMRYTPWSNESEVTNHVGEIGIMSRLARELRERDRAMGLHTSADAEAHNHEHSHEHGHHHGRRTHAIKRGGGKAAPSPSPPSTSPLASQAGPAGVISSLAEYHARRHAGGAAAHGGRGHPAASAPGAASPRHSGVQAEILGMYRQMLREVGRMQDPETRRNLQAYIRAEYDKNVDVPRKHIAKIEWCLNTGKRKLEDLQRMSPHTKFSVRT